MQLSEHFTLGELTFSSTAVRLGYFNIPSEENVSNLKILCETLLEPARTLLDAPFHIDSGYRTPLLNSAIGGASNSAHMEGRAADVIPIGLSLQDAFDRLRKSALPFDQIIFETLQWIHLAIAPFGKPPRREALTARGVPGSWVYEKVA